MRERIFEICTSVDASIDFNAGNLVDGGILDSVTMIEIVSEIMDQLDIEIPFEEVTPDNFNSVDAMVALVERYV